SQLMHSSVIRNAMAGSCSKEVGRACVPRACKQVAPCGRYVSDRWVRGPWPVLILDFFGRGGECADGNVAPWRPNRRFFACLYGYSAARCGFAHCLGFFVQPSLYRRKDELADVAT